MMREDDAGDFVEILLVLRLRGRAAQRRELEIHITNRPILDCQKPIGSSPILS